MENHEKSQKEFKGKVDAKKVLKRSQKRPRSLQVSHVIDRRQENSGAGDRGEKSRQYESFQWEYQSDSGGGRAFGLVTARSRQLSGRVMSKSPQMSEQSARCSWMGMDVGDTSDDAYFSEMSSEASVRSFKSHDKESKTTATYHKHEKIIRKQASITDAVLLCGSPSPSNENVSIKSVMSGVNTKLSKPNELAINENTIGCHCQACCSCHGNNSPVGCIHHPTACKKCSDSANADSSQATESDSNANLPSPTSISSWGHFSKTTQNHYKYRRSDYSSDSDDDLPLKKNDRNSASQMPLVCHHKSHLPKITITLSRQSSASSYKSVTERSGSNASDVNFSTKEGVPPLDFKDKSTTLLKWFSDFNDEQKNLVLKDILNICDLPQIHLLSVKMQANLHHGCPPNCQDLLTWLPANQAARIMSYLDPVSLCRASQVCKMWHQLTDEPSLWRRFCCQQKWRLSKAAEHKQVISHMSPQGSIQWKEVFAERFRLRQNWLKGRCTVRTFEGHSQGISCVQFDDSRIVSGSSDKTIKVWNIRTNAQWSVQTLVGHSGTVRCLHLEGNRLVSGSTDCMIKVWDLSTQESWSSIACKVTMTGHSDTVRCLQVDDQKVVSGSYDKTLKIWDINSGRCKLTLRGHQAAVLCVHFNDTKVVSGSCDKTIKVWNYEGACVRTLCGHQDAVTCLQFDATRIVSGSLDCNLKFWDIHTGECVNTIDWKAAEGHTGVVRCLQADNWRLVSAADDKTIKVWNLDTGKRLVTLRNHTDGVTCLQFNDFIIVSGSYDKTVKLWDFSSC